MASIWGTTYGDTQRGIGWYPRREPARSSPSLWDYIEAAAMTPVPGVADVASGALAARDFGAGRWGQGLLNAAGALPVVPALGQIFIGVKGANKAQKQALVTAQKMAKEGANRDEIWNATMWYRGKDGKWRTEISDAAAKVDMSKAGPDAVKLGSVLDHPELFKTYPELADVNFRAIPESGGSYLESANLINVQDPVWNMRTNPRSVTFHEVSHPIQKIEGMARGGSPEAMAEEAWNTPKELQLARRIVDLSQQFPPRVIDQFLEQYHDPGVVKTAKTMVNKLGADTVTRLYDESLAENAAEGYKRLLGEVDARNTQARMDMTLDQRRQFAPWSTWDVPEEQQIVRFGDGPAMLRGLLGR